MGGDSVLDESLYLLYTEICVEGRCFQGGKRSKSLGDRGNSFGGPKRGGPSRTMRIPGEVSGAVYFFRILRTPLRAIKPSKAPQDPQPVRPG